MKELAAKRVSEWDSKHAEFRCLDEHERYRSTVFSVHTGRYVSPAGAVFERDILHHPGAVGVVPLLRLENGKLGVVLLRQYRPATGTWVLEIPAGLRDVSGEDPARTAARELEEETGYRAGALEQLFCAYVSPGISDEEVIVYMATGLERASALPQGPEEAYARSCVLALDEAIKSALSNEVVDLKTIAGLFAAREAVNEREGLEL